MHIPTNKTLAWSTALALMLLVGCQKSTDVVTVATQDCQLQTERTAYNGSTSGQTTTYSYNAASQLTKRVTSSDDATAITYTYSYDATGKLVTALTRGSVAKTSIDISNTYEYTGDRLVKVISTYSGSSPTTTVDSYSYDNAGQLVTYSYSSTDPQQSPQSYSFTSGLLTGGAISRGGQSLSLTIADGHILSETYPDGRQDRYSYDAKGYLTRTESLDKVGALQSYTVYEYSPVAYKRSSTPFRLVPVLRVYGATELPPSRVGIYNADGSLKSETRYQYAVNSKGYITSLGYVQSIAGVSGQGTGLTTYTYSDCP